MSFTIMTDTSANLPEEFLRENEIPCISYHFVVDGEVLPEDYVFEGKEFFENMRQGHVVSTSQIPPQRYADFFRVELEKGNDVLFVSMSSGISGSFNSASIAAEELREEFPERTISLIDSIGASLGEGLLVMAAVRDRKNGMSLEAVTDKLMGQRYATCNVFTVDDLKYLKRTGRLSNVAVFIGAILQIKPLLKGNMEGKIVGFEKVRGRKAAIKAMAESFRTYAVNGNVQTVGIAHADCEDDANKLADMLRAIAPGVEVLTVMYEPVTGSHVGPGTLALFFEGSPNFRE